MEKLKSRKPQFIKLSSSCFRSKNVIFISPSLLLLLVINLNEFFRWACPVLEIFVFSNLNWFEFSSCLKVNFAPFSLLSLALNGASLNWRNCFQTATAGTLILTHVLSIRSRISTEFFEFTKTASDRPWQPMPRLLAFSPSFITDRLVYEAIQWKEVKNDIGSLVNEHQKSHT